MEESSLHSKREMLLKPPLFPELLFWKTHEVNDFFLQHCICMAILTQVYKCLRQASSLRNSRKTITPNPVPKDVQCATLFRWSMGKHMIWGQLVSFNSLWTAERKVCPLLHRLCLNPTLLEAWKLLKPVKGLDRWNMSGRQTCVLAPPVSAMWC